MRQTVLLLLVLIGPAAAMTYGSRIAWEDFPYTASLQWQQRHKCGGTLISPDTVLSVAHCYSLVWVDPKRNEMVSVLFGTPYQWSLRHHEPHEFRARVRKVVWPPGVPEKFKTKEGMRSTPLDAVPNDYMILKLDRNITTIPLSRLEDCRGKNKPKVGAICMTAGWGRYRVPDSKDPYAEIFPRQLRKGVVRIESDSACQGGAKTMMCSRQVVEKKHPMGQPCYGDSGSPLMCKGSCGNWYLSGLVEAGLGSCNRINNGLYFMRISSIMNWIKGNM